MLMLSPSLFLSIDEQLLWEQPSNWNEMKWNETITIHSISLVFQLAINELSSGWDSLSKVNLFWMIFWAKGRVCVLLGIARALKAAPKYELSRVSLQTAFLYRSKEAVCLSVWLTTGSLTDLSRLLGAETFPTTERATAATKQRSFKLAKGASKSLRLSLSPNEHMERQ